MSIAWNVEHKKRSNLHWERMGIHLVEVPRRSFAAAAWRLGGMIGCAIVSGFLWYGGLRLAAWGLRALGVRLEAF